MDMVMDTAMAMVMEKDMVMAMEEDMAALFSCNVQHIPYRRERTVRILNDIM